MLLVFHLGPFAIEYPELLVPMVIGFALFVFCVCRMPADIPLGIPYLRKELQNRAARIADNDTQVKRELEDIQRLRDDYVARIHRIEEEARIHIDTAVREADTARAEIIAEAQQAAATLRRRADEEIARERTRQRIQLRQQIVQITLGATEQSVRTHTNETVQRQLIGDFIARAAKGSGGNGAVVRAAPTGDGATPPQTRTQREGEA